MEPESEEESGAGNAWIVVVAFAWFCAGCFVMAAIQAHRLRKRAEEEEDLLVVHRFPGQPASLVHASGHLAREVRFALFTPVSVVSRLEDARPRPLEETRPVGEFDGARDVTAARRRRATLKKRAGRSR